MVRVKVEITDKEGNIFAVNVAVEKLDSEEDFCGVNDSNGEAESDVLCVGSFVYDGLTEEDLLNKEVGLVVISAVESADIEGEPLELGETKFVGETKFETDESADALEEVVSMNDGKVVCVTIDGELVKDVTAERDSLTILVIEIEARTLEETVTLCFGETVKFPDFEDDEVCNTDLDIDGRVEVDCVSFDEAVNTVEEDGRIDMVEPSLDVADNKVVSDIEGDDEIVRTIEVVCESVDNPETLDINEAVGESEETTLSDDISEKYGLYVIKVEEDSE